MFLQITVHHYTSVAPARRHAPARLRACVSDCCHTAADNIGAGWPAAGIAAYPHTADPPAAGSRLRRPAAIAAPSIIRWLLARPNGTAASAAQAPTAAQPPLLCPADGEAVTGA